MPSIPMVVVETPVFIRQVERLLSAAERMELITFLGENPDAGDVMAGTGGCRKLRWGMSGRGKRGGVRVIYYFHDESIPIFLLSVFAKNTQLNLSKADQNAIRALIPKVVAGYQKKEKR